MRYRIAQLALTLLGIGWVAVTAYSFWGNGPNARPLETGFASVLELACAGLCFWGAGRMARMAQLEGSLKKRDED